MRLFLGQMVCGAAMILCAGPTLAFDQLLIGKKVLITNPASGTANNRIVFLSKDQSILLPGQFEDPRCLPHGTGAGGALVVGSATTGEGFTITLPCFNWTLKAAGQVHKYSDPSGDTCKVLIVKGGTLLKAVCKGTQVSYDLGANQGSVDVKVRTGTAPRQWCTSFNATTSGCTVVKDGSDNKKYLAKNCTAPAVACPASPSGAFVETVGVF